MIDTAAIQISRSLPKVKLTGFFVDEIGVEKKGDKSVGVGHQYCGNVGKTANSQVAVMGCLSNGYYNPSRLDFFKGIYEITGTLEINKFRPNHAFDRLEKLGT